MRILIIEDNELVVKAVERQLRNTYVIDIAKDGAHGLSLARSGIHDVILLDLNLPEIDGVEICKSIRKSKLNTPIIIISGRDEIKDKISLLDMGADDYITKPFNIAELAARINVAMRHISVGNTGKYILIEDLVLDPLGRTVKRADININLRKKEFDLLEYLARNQGRTLTRKMILEHIWTDSEELWANVVDVHIKHLRDKIDRDFTKKLIKTVHGSGYKIEA